MKKYLFIALAATALVSCSQDETLDNVQGEAISFGGSFIEKTTRATDPTYGTNGVSLDKFNVYGTVTGTTNNNSTTTAVNIFNGDEVTRPSSLATNTYSDATAWVCNKTQYWIAGAAYNFAAVVDATAVNCNTATGMPESLDYTYSSSSQKDLLYATASVSSALASGNGLVKFTFDHLLAKANFTVTNNTSGTNNTEYTYTIKDIKVTNAYQSGTYTISNKTWGSTTTGATAFSNIESVANGNTKTCDTEILFIPAESLNITYTVELKKGDSLISSNTYTQGDIKFEAGHAYNFNLTVGLGQIIEFTVTAAPSWTTPATNVTL